MAQIFRRVFRNNFLISRCETCIYRSFSSETTSVSDEVRLIYENDSTCFNSASYSSKEQQKILKVVNKCNLEELTQYEITQLNAERLIRKRKTFGQFSTLNDLIVSNIDDGQLYSLCDSVVHGLSIEGQKRLESKWKLCYPTISEETAQNVNSCVVLQINSEDLTYLHLSRSLKILQWEHVQLTNCTKLQGNSRTLELARDIVCKLPMSDVYLMDDRKIELRSLKTAPVILRMVRLECMIAALLNWDYVSSNVSRVCLLKNDVVASFFRLKVGNEQVSGQSLVQDLIHGGHNSDLRKVTVDRNVWFRYNEKPSDIRELLAKALLKGFAFYQLEIAKMPVRTMTT